jgi:hypothetical protein
MEQYKDLWISGHALLPANLALMFSASRCVDAFVLLPNRIFREASLLAQSTQLRLAHANTASEVFFNAAL